MLPIFNAIMLLILVVCAVDALIARRFLRNTPEPRPTKLPLGQATDGRKRSPMESSLDAIEETNDQWSKV
jgi:hypothetical protein